MSFLSPAWLVGLALLPLLWWLHRTSSRGRSVYVSSLLLWPPEAAARTAPSAQIRELDLAWLRRATALAALSLGLAGPQFSVSTAPLIVWLDGAASLDTVEDGSARIDRALRELTARVGERGGGEVVIRSLAEPSFAVIARAPFGGIAGRRPVGAPQLPPRASLDPRAEHWVVTDGASAAVNEWIGRMPVAAVVRVGEATENVALIGLAARPALGARGRLDVEVRVRNAGHHPAKREVRLEGAGGARRSAQVELPAATTATLRMDLDDGALPLVARLTPADALERDDVLELAATPLRAPVAVDPDCGAALRAAILAHPRLAPSRPGPDALSVECGPDRGVVAGVHLRVRRDGPSRRLAQRAAWLLPEGASPLPGVVRVRSTLARPAADDRVLIAAGEEPLVVDRRASRTVECAIDLDDPALAASGAYPLLVAALADAALGRRLLDELPAAQRAPSAAAIAPLMRFPARLARVPAPRGASVDLSGAALAVAIALLLLDSALAIAALRRDLAYYRGAAR